MTRADMEAALLAAEDLADAFDFFDQSGCQASVSQLYAALAAYRRITGASQ